MCIQETVPERSMTPPELPGPGSLPALNDITLTDYNAEEAAAIRDELVERFSDWIR